MEGLSVSLALSYKQGTLFENVLLVLGSFLHWHLGNTRAAVIR